MREKALYYHKNGYNCSQCIIMAAKDKYRLKISKNYINSFSGICTGFGTGSICSSLVAGVFIFGLMFDETTAKSLRLRLFSEFTEKYKSIDCITLKEKSKSCTFIIGDAAELIDRIILSELR